MNTIPDWDLNGVIPPIDINDPVGPVRSPYRVRMTEFVTRFATTPERCALIRSLIDFRAALHRLGIEQGFQWIDGSFAEHVELLENRPPNDTDVVTFVEQATQSQAGDPRVLVQSHVKATFRVDSYLVNLQGSPRKVTERVAYWYSLLGHRRTGLWKGFVEVELDRADDAAAVAILDRAADGGIAP